MSQKNVAADSADLLYKIVFFWDDFVDASLIEPNLDKEAQPSKSKRISQKKIDPFEERNLLHLKIPIKYYRFFFETFNFCFLKFGSKIEAG